MMELRMAIARCLLTSKRLNFEKAGNPNEPPVYGSKVLEEKSSGVSDRGTTSISIFDPNSQDGKNSMALYTLVYDPKSFKSS